MLECTSRYVYWICTLTWPLRIFQGMNVQDISYEAEFMNVQFL
jgi:hypothetical protein